MSKMKTKKAIEFINEMIEDIITLLKRGEKIEEIVNKSGKML